MRSEIKVSDQNRSFIEVARRAQIIDAAIEVIGEVGYGKASLARIAQKVGISTGVISYHFVGKDELIQEVVNEVFTVASAFMEPRMEAAEEARAKLRAHIESNIEFIHRNPRHIQAIRQIVIGASDGGGSWLVDLRGFAAVSAQLEKLLRDGQSSGEFTDFDPRVVAVSIRAAIDAASDQLSFNPHLDLIAHGQELARFVERGIEARS